jgi:uncharacterized membrane protein YphA (DoxX/SURF4 family)
MTNALLLARLVLAAVFATAGVTKLIAPGESHQTAVQFGVPPRLAGAVARFLPVGELATAALLVGDASAVWGAAALVRLGIFTVAVVANLARGKTPDCHCFGQLHSAPIRATTGTACSPPLPSSSCRTERVRT